MVLPPTADSASGLPGSGLLPGLRALEAGIHSVLAPLVPRDGRLALLDFPDHGNVGDSMIWLGEIRYFRRRHGIRPRYASKVSDFCPDALARALPHGPIFLHGGGNFGDIWPVHQRFRETVLEAYPDRPIVQLPQTIQFESGENLERASRIINGHPDFTLLVRDRRSYELAKSTFTCKVALCPDMAFCLGRQRRGRHPGNRLLLLLRADKETRTIRPQIDELPPGASLEDWAEDEPDLWSRIDRDYRMRWPLLQLFAQDEAARRELRFRIEAGLRLRRGRAQLASARHVITDRLHVHILCLLLGIPHTTIDNNYGKIRLFEETWTRELSLVRQASDLAEALASFRSTESSRRGYFGVARSPDGGPRGVR